MPSNVVPSVSTLRATTPPGLTQATGGLAQAGNAGRAAVQRGDAATGACGFQGEVTQTAAEVQYIAGQIRQRQPFKRIELEFARSYLTLE